MTKNTVRCQETASTLFGFVLVGEAVACVLFSLAHFGVRIPLGFATLREPRGLAAGVVEAMCGLVLTVGGGALLARRSWALTAALTAQIFSVGGFTLGVVATLRSGGTDPVNNDFHRVMLPLFVLGVLAAVAMRRRPVMRDA